jgi:enoyl-CoA hydratase/carnithine racemase
MTEIPMNRAGEPIVLTEQRGRVAVVRMNRPEARNAMSDELSQALVATWQRLEADDDTRAYIITGVDDKAFCAGADLKSAAGRAVSADRPQTPPLPASEDQIGYGGVTPRLTKPIIAAVNGYALGGGCEICLACDLIVIEEHALIGLPEVLRGIIAGAGGVERLPRRIPPSIALECILTGKPLTAQRAYEVGLANRVAAAGTGVDVAMELAEAICDASPLAVRYSKAIASATFHAGELDARHAAAELRQLWWNSEDLKDGLSAFARGRTPAWKGR